MLFARKVWISGALVAVLFAVPTDERSRSVTLTIDAAVGRRVINPNIYGMAGATLAQLQDLNVPLNRYGGNNASRYNWQINADNRGSDWYFESVAETSSVAGQRAATFIADARTAGAEAAITVPMIGWVAKLGPNRSKLASFSQAKYGPQTGNDWQWFPDAGNGILQSTGLAVANNDPNDANVPNSPAFQQQWVQAIVGQWGLAASGGQRYYVLDNEPSLWHSTHRDIQPTGVTMDETFGRLRDYAVAIKSVDAGAVIMGPEEWGWTGYLLSGYDQQYGQAHGWSVMPDRNSHGGSQYLPWLLTQLKADGRHLLDVFTVHFYPQGGEYSSTVTTSMQLRRNRSTRALWDPAYVDKTWINDMVMLIPRLRTWVDSYYVPGTPTGITEYNWGAENHINGATAQADILGIFGREGLDLAARWRTPAASTPTYQAIKLYRNYDGNHSTFGDVSVAAGGANPDDVAVFAAERTTDGALTVMVVAKALSGDTPVDLSLLNFAPGRHAEGYQLTAANAIARLADLDVAGATASFIAPAQSVTLLVFPKSGVLNQPPQAVASATPLSGPTPLAVTFSASGSNDPDGTIASYAWAFGDGAAGAGPSVSHTYLSAGTYATVLTVTDNAGAIDTAAVSVTATPGTTVIAAPTSLSGKGSKGRATLSWRDNAYALG